MRLLLYAENREALSTAAVYLRRLLGAGRGRMTVLAVQDRLPETFLHQEALHREELEEVARLLGNEGPTADLLRAARRAFKTQGFEVLARAREGEAATAILAELQEGSYDLAAVAIPAEDRRRFADLAGRLATEAKVPVLFLPAPPAEGGTS